MGPIWAARTTWPAWPVYKAVHLASVPCFDSRKSKFHVLSSDLRNTDKMLGRRRIKPLSKNCGVLGVAEGWFGGRLRWLRGEDFQVSYLCILLLGLRVSRNSI